mmetsp:Transcript_122205/g.260756  ORF Transcript_122205/g.260756 Transcript_122205/m.260756 type:complete len:86 (+) Transcript_122205:120-377(+)
MQQIVVGDTTEQELAKALRDSVARFAKDGSPGPLWPRWTYAEDTLQLGSDNSSEFLKVHGYRRDICALMEKKFSSPRGTSSSILV